MRDKDLSQLLSHGCSQLLTRQLSLYSIPLMFSSSPIPWGGVWSPAAKHRESPAPFSCLILPFIVGGLALSLPQCKNTPKLSMKCKQEGWGEQCGPLACCWLRCQRLLTNGSMPTWRQALSCSTTKSITLMSQKTAMLGSDDTGLEQAHRWQD